MSSESSGKPAAAASPPSRIPAPLHRLAARLGPDYTIFVVFASILVVLTVLHPVKFRWRTYTVEMSGTAAFLMILVRFSRQVPGIMAGRSAFGPELRAATVNTLRDWGPFFLLALVFANLETYTTFFRDRVIDDVLYKMDIAVFGVEPTVWLSRLNHPLLTDAMAMAYTSYILTPIVLGGFMLLRERREAFQEMSTAAILQLYLAFLICLVFPAGPPRYYAPLVHGGFDPPALSSFFGLYEVQQISFDKADPLATRSAFPSLHCSLALFTLIYAWRHGDAVFPRRPRLFFGLCVPLVVALWTSTVYLRHHWVPDIAAGMILAVVASYLAPRMRRAWPRLAPAADAASARAEAETEAAA